MAVNALEKWDHVGPRSNDYPTEVVKNADTYLRHIVSLAHDAGGKAVSLQSLTVTAPGRPGAVPTPSQRPAGNGATEARAFALPS